MVTWPDVQPVHDLMLCKKGLCASLPKGFPYLLQSSADVLCNIGAHTVC